MPRMGIPFKYQGDARCQLWPVGGLGYGRQHRRVFLWGNEPRLQAESPLWRTLNGITVLTEGMRTSGSSSGLARMMEKIKKIFHEESGVSVTEYGLVLLLVATVLIGVLGILGTSISGRFTDYATKFGS
jgi:pilus assembly protein Flp/PilA